MEPPVIVRNRRSVARLSEKNRQEINEYGLTVPSKKRRNYEPSINKTALLFNMRTGFNYRKKANENKKVAQQVYQNKRATMKNLENSKKLKNKSNNLTRKTLF